MTEVIRKKIKNKQISSMYLFYGTETFLINELKEMLTSELLEEHEKDFNYAIYDLEETPIEVALEDAETLPFMGEKRMIVLKKPYFLTAEKGKEKVEHSLERLEKYILQPAPYSVIVFIAPYEKLDERKKITKLLKQHAEVLEVNALEEKDLIKWIGNRAAMFQVTFEDHAAKLLMQLTGPNLMLISKEIDKLSLYVGPEGDITQETVNLLVARTLEQNIFELIDKAVHRKLEEAFRIFYDLLKNNEEPIKILSLLATQFRMIYQVKELVRQGYGQQQIAGMLKVHPYRVKLAAGQSNLFSNEHLMGLVNHLAEMDYEIKNGKIDKKLAVELFLMKLNN
ncbi:DNA polymerase III subunit delta [Bacillus luteolus]|uniref:DNA polymerase III subunit delta n=1 Tax=Litchfieldia luteola TaxID=682179 RepID=A0ABR9QHS0_9BACI|nr:DNA polymerase III subunit delta [Cytobacillus luteolus]MBE4908046.1 DNA polymerase III subunit delta [Cytobacillus luteolus]MBP1942829.1 DNA polymerase-3 subunit delta [Cytobacillus luteolus]